MAGRTRGRDLPCFPENNTESYINFCSPPKKSIRDYFQELFFSCTTIYVYSNTVMSSSSGCCTMLHNGGGRAFTYLGLIFGVGLILRASWKIIPGLIFGETGYLARVLQRHSLSMLPPGCLQKVYDQGMFPDYEPELSTPSRTGRIAISESNFLLNSSASILSSFNFSLFT